MGLVQLAKNLFDRRKTPTLEVFRMSIPVRNGQIEVEDNGERGIVLMAPLNLEGKRWLSSMAKAAKVPPMRKIELDPVGSFVWRLCDGKHTFEGISHKLREQFRMKRVEGDAALGAFLQMLSQRKLITLMVKDRK